MTKQNLVLKAAGIVKQFGGLCAVDDVTIELYEKEIVGLIGPNGAGKTTMFNMISGVLPLSKGSISLNGKKVNNIKSYKMAALGIGRTYQVVQPFSNLTVLENTMVGAFLRVHDTEHARKKAADVLKTVDLQQKADVKGSDLGLLDLKRMEIARALATDPQILLLDEVMAGLNPTGHIAVIEMIKKIRDRDMSIIIIEHNMHAVMELSDRIYVLNQEKLLAHGKPEEISNDPLVIQAYLGGKRYA